MTQQFHEIDEFLTVEIKPDLAHTPYRVTLHASNHNQKGFREPGQIDLYHSEVLVFLAGLTCGKWFQSGERLIAYRVMSEICPYQNWTVMYNFSAGSGFAIVQESSGIIFLPRLTLTKLREKAVEILAHLECVDRKQEWSVPNPPSCLQIDCTCNQCCKPN